MSSAGDDPSGGFEPRGVRSLCPNCGSVCESDQEYCLACGERLFAPQSPATGTVERIRDSIPFADREWAWPVLIALAIAVLASLIAFLSTRGSGTNTLQALGPRVQTISSSSSGAATTVARTQTGTTSATSVPKPPINATGVIAWPGPPAYTIVLASLPLSSGKASARLKALEAIDAGLGDVGVLKSSDYSSLHPGYYVVFSGVFQQQSAAFRHLPAARRAGFNSPYVKRVAS